MPDADSSQKGDRAPGRAADEIAPPNAGLAEPAAERTAPDASAAPGDGAGARRKIMMIDDDDDEPMLGDDETQAPAKSADAARGSTISSSLNFGRCLSTPSEKTAGAAV